MHDWQLPPGVSRPLWDYFHDPAAAQSYDAQLADTPLLTFDQRFVLDYCRPPGKVLDLGCGTGRLAITLARHGYRPLAIDLSPEMLRVVGAKARALGLDVPRLQANLVELNCLNDAGFDHAACLFSTLGLIEGAENRRRFLVHVHRLLRPGGRFVVHVHNRWFHLWTRHGRRLLLKNLGRGDFLMPPHQGAGPLTIHLFTRREVARLLREAGFDLLEVQPITPAGPLPRRWFLPRLGAYGYLIASHKPACRGVPLRDRSAVERT